MVEFIPQEIPELVLINLRKFEDDRGFFMETYKSSLFHSQGIQVEFVQDNFSKSKKGVLRGLHYQLNPMAQGKLVSVTRGKAFDVAVDIRKNSPTFGQYVSVILDEKNPQAFWIPSGFAHGFLALEDNTYLTYKVTSEYSKDDEAGIIYNDETISIDWPLDEAELIHSEKDLELPSLVDAHNNFTYRQL